MKKRLIWGIVGSVGVGKTTITTALSQFFDAEAIYEEWENNKYLEKFYENKNILQNQMWFIKNDISRFRMGLKSEKDIVIIDKLFVQNFTYIDITSFRKEEKEICLHEYYKNFSLINKVDLIINITEKSEIILERIIKRNRKLKENTLSLEWIDSFVKHQSNYLDFLSKEYKIKLLTYNNGFSDFKELENALKNLI